MSATLMASLSLERFFASVLPLWWRVNYTTKYYAIAIIVSMCMAIASSSLLLLNLYDNNCAESAKCMYVSRTSKVTFVSMLASYSLQYGIPAIVCMTLNVAIIIILIKHKLKQVEEGHQCQSNQIVVSIVALIMSMLAMACCFYENFMRIYNAVVSYYNMNARNGSRGYALNNVVAGMAATMYFSFSLLLLFISSKSFREASWNKLVKCCHCHSPPVLTTEGGS